MDFLTREQFEAFAQEEFPNKITHWGGNYCYIQAGNRHGDDVHYEYIEQRVDLHIEGPNWRGLRNYLWANVTDSRVSNYGWGRQGCRWTINREITCTEDVYAAFREIRRILEPYILKYELTLGEMHQEIAAPERVHAHFETIDSILKLKLEIPEYQRPYTWKEKNVRQLLEDINQSRCSGKNAYLIGSIILHTPEKDGAPVFNIVDGQQRITTLILLIKNLDDNYPTPTLSFNHIDSFRNIKANYGYIKEWLNKYISNRSDFLKYVLEACRMVEIDVKELSEAFQMFESQNGRGKELEAYNLLKAYHLRAMESDSREDRISSDRNWENAAMFFVEKDKPSDLLKQLFGEQLYRTRLWSKGIDAYSFSKKRIEEFKGLTLTKETNLDYPYQNAMLQRMIAEQTLKSFNSSLFKIKGRFIHGDPDNLNPFANINQLILNGKSFFEYTETFVEIYKRLFIDLESSQLEGFKEFYKKNCLYYDGAGRTGDGYLLECYKSLIMAVFDRFGEVGVNELFYDLYVIIYSLRLEYSQIRYQTVAKYPNNLFVSIYSAKGLSDLHSLKAEANNRKGCKVNFVDRHGNPRAKVVYNAIKG